MLDFNAPTEAEKAEIRRRKAAITRRIRREVLAEYGITEQSVGAPIRATMDTRELGQLPSGARVYFDALAAAADATIVVNRVKAHTAFRGEIESGLCKMTAIGLGKQRGAEQTHDHGLRETIPAAAELSLGAPYIIAGLALVENAAHELAVVRATPPSVPAHTTSGSLGSMAMPWMSGCSKLPSTAGDMSYQVSPPSGLRMSTKIQL